MLVDSIGDVTITNDGATILKLLEVEHPAAKVLVQLADLQDQEVGDGTTSVVLLAAEMLKVYFFLFAKAYVPKYHYVSPIFFKPASKLLRLSFVYTYHNNFLKSKLCTIFQSSM